MNRNPILVRNINHLTDARYFAAMGVDWMSIELNTDPASFLMWHTFRDWVEGVILAAEINADDEWLLAKTIIDARPDGVIVKNNSSHDIPPTIPVFYEVNSPDHIILTTGDLFILSFDTEWMLSINSILKFPPDRIFLQAAWSKEILSSVLEKGYSGGICFAGGQEDKTGIRDYGEMDEMLERLGR